MNWYKFDSIISEIPKYKIYFLNYYIFIWINKQFFQSLAIMQTEEDKQTIMISSYELEEQAINKPWKHTIWSSR